jgi:hypothetical protein
VSGAINTDEHPLGETKFVRYLKKRDAVERAIADQPSLLKDKRVLKQYEALWKKTYEIRKKWAKKKGDRFKKDKIHARLKGLEIMEKTERHVDRLYQLILE